MSFIKRVLGDPNEREIKKLRPLVEQINSLEPEIQDMSDDEMRSRSAEFREQLDQTKDQDEQDEVLDTILPEAFALVREAGRRALGMRHYDVQLIGGIVLHQGKIAEMGTGEGKTLVATSPLYLNALTGRGAHLITTNDYLAHRDAEWMGQIYRFLGLSVGTILSGPEHQDPNEKRQGYGADITYGTNNEFGFDYLRDNMAADKQFTVQRQLNFALVDEVDNILIDEARTPLIISAPTTESAETYVRFARVIPILKEEEDYTIDLKSRTVAITNEGIDKVEAALGIQNIYADMDVTRYLENALKAQAIMQRDRDYIVRDGEVIIVDEHTGRMMVGRRFNEGLHQAIEAKERVRVQAENRTVATITFQNYFRLYRTLAGMTGTALTEAQEFDKIYKLDVVVIPTNRSRIRKDETDYVYKSVDGKFDAVAREIKERHVAGQPVLVGTTSVELSEALSRKLDLTGIPYEILNAKNHQREASIIAQAGRSGAVTISTNMAGRGTDILLGGNPAGYVDQILSEWDIDVDVASDEDRAEALAEAARRCEEDREKVIALGGLHVIGTERHDSRRIDNQLRGRSGRQGDPGSTRFYVSMGDDLMRRFNSERVAGIMDRLGMDEDTPIENRVVSSMIEQAQQKVEAYYFDIRKHLVEYDDVIAKQREIIYEDRQAILEKADMHDRVTQMIKEEVANIVGPHTEANAPENWDLEAVDAFFERWRIPLPDEFFPENLNALKRAQFIKDCAEFAAEQYDARLDHLHEQAEQLGVAATAGIDEQLRQFERNIMLRVVDQLWMEHIDTLDELRSSIGLRAIAQTDPLVEFKREGYGAFERLKEQIRHYVAETIMMLDLQIGAPPPAAEPPPQPKQLSTNTAAIAEASGQSKSEGAVAVAPTRPNSMKPLGAPKKPLTQNKALKQASRKPTPEAVPATTTNGNGNGKPVATKSKTPSRPLPTNPPKLGPNDPCFCGSKQKYKFCHGLQK